MAQITVYAQSDGNWDKADNWDTVPGGGGTDYTNPQNGGGNTFICDLNGYDIAMNVDVTVDRIVEDTANGTLVVSDTRVLTVSANPGVSYSGTDTSGCIRIGTGGALTITHDQGAGTTAIQASAAGYAVVTSGSGVLSISNSGGTAVTCSSSGRGVSHGSTGAMTVTGAVSCSGTGYGIVVGAASTNTITGKLSTSASYGYAIRIAGGTTTVNGDIASAANIGALGSGGTVQLYSGTMIWSAASTRTVAAGEVCSFRSADSSYTLTLTDVVLQNSGICLLMLQSASINHTGFTLTNMTSSAQAAIVGHDIAVTGPTLPGAGDVDSTAADYGYAGALTEATCVLPAVADVKDGVLYGAAGTEFEGELAGGGGGSRGVIIGG